MDADRSQPGFSNGFNNHIEFDSATLQSCNNNTHQAMSTEDDTMLDMFTTGALPDHEFVFWDCFDPEFHLEANSIDPGFDYNGVSFQQNNPLTDGHDFPLNVHDNNFNIPSASYEDPTGDAVDPCNSTGGSYLPSHSPDLPLGKIVPLHEPIQNLELAYGDTDFATTTSQQAYNQNSSFTTGTESVRSNCPARSIYSSSIPPQQSLPPKRTGGKRGPRSPEEIAQRKRAKVKWKCIRCYLTKKPCTGDTIPCDRCSSNANPRTWTNRPCVKAQFFDIIEGGSFFSALALSELQLTQNESDISIKSIASFMFYFHQVDPWLGTTSSILSDIKCSVPWFLGLIVLLDMFFKSSNQGVIEFARPTRTTVAKGWLNIVEVLDKMQLRVFPFGVESSEVHERASILMSLYVLDCNKFDMNNDQVEIFCTSTNNEIALSHKAANVLMLVTLRIQELLLVKHLQKVSDHLESYNTEEKKSYIFAMMEYALLVPRCTKKLLEKMGLNEHDRMVKDALDELHERQNRIEQAFGVYCCVAIEKLPAWSGFWQEVREKQPQFCDDNVLRKLKGNFEGFKEDLFQLVGEEMANVRKIAELSSIYEALDSSFELPVETGLAMTMENVCKVREEWFSDPSRKDAAASIDRMRSGGLFTADTEEKQNMILTQMFPALNFISWEKLQPTRADTSDYDNQLFSTLIDTIRKRRSEIEVYEAIMAFLGKSHESESITSDLAMKAFKDLYTDEQLESHGIEKILSCLASGRRWKALISSFGTEDIILLGPCQFPPLSTTLPSMDLSIAVDLSSETEFEAVKDAYITYCPWISKFLSKLRNLTDLIVELGREGAYDDTLALRIRNRVTSAFGECDKTLGFLDSIKHSANPEVALIPMIMASMNSVLDQENSNREQRRKFLDKVLPAFATILIRITSEGISDTQKIADVCEETLHEAVREFCSEEQDHFSDAEKTMVCLSQATTSLTEPICWLAHARNERSSDTLQEKCIVNMGNRIIEHLNRCETAISDVFSDQ